MTRNEVIQLADNIPFFTTPCWIAFFTLLVLTVVMVLLAVKHFNNKKWDTPLALGILLFGFGSIVPVIVGADINNNAWDDWEENVARPYIHSLEEEKAYPMDVDLAERNLVTLIFKENDGINRYTGAYEVKPTLASGEKPYVTYRHLKENIKTLEEGYYEVIVFVPEDYQF